MLGIIQRIAHPLAEPYQAARGSRPTTFFRPLELSMTAITWVCHRACHFHNIPCQRTHSNCQDATTSTCEHLCVRMLIHIIYNTPCVRLTPCAYMNPRSQVFVCSSPVAPAAGTFAAFWPRPWHGARAIFVQLLRHFCSGLVAADFAVPPALFFFRPPVALHFAMAPTSLKCSFCVTFARAVLLPILPLQPGTFPAF